MADNSDPQSSISDSSSAPKSSIIDDAIPPPPWIPTFLHFRHLQHVVPVMFPALVPGPHSVQNPEQMNRGPGIYAVPVLPFMGTVTGIPTKTLIPLTYSPPTRTASSEAGTVSGDQSQAGQQPQQPAPQRPGIPRRFQIVFQLDIALIVKLAAVIFIFNQDGSRQRLALLVFFASIVYLYQTGALTPLMQWVSQAMHRAAAPPRPPRPAARVEPIVRQENENGGGAGGDAQLGEDDNPPAGDPNHVAENEAEVEGGNQWWGIVKEIQMIVFGFITSLLPGFHNIDHA